MTRPAILYRSFANGDLHQCQAFQQVATKIKNKLLDCLFKYSASATLQVYTLNSAVEQLCCPLVNTPQPRCNTIDRSQTMDRVS